MPQELCLLRGSGGMFPENFKLQDSLRLIPQYFEKQIKKFKTSKTLLNLDVFNNFVSTLHLFGSVK